MFIEPQRAFWILDYYRTHQTRLAFGGKILGEEGACLAAVSHVWPKAHSIAVRLLTDDGTEAWERLIPLERVVFSLIQMGDPLFEQFKMMPIHSILIMNFPGGTTIFLAETERPN